MDKPLVDNARDLETFRSWVRQGAPILSSSSMRYTKEFLPYRTSTHNLGALRYVSVTSGKKWETYGIHALEAVYPIMGPGFLSCRNTGTALNAFLIREMNISGLFIQGQGIDKA